MFRDKGVVNDGVVLVRRGTRVSQNVRAQFHLISKQEGKLHCQDRAQLRNEFLSFDTENKGTITHLQALPFSSLHLDIMLI